MVVEITFITDKNYLIATAAACNSIIKSKRKNTALRIHVVSTDLSDSMQKYFLSMSQEGAEIVVINATNHLEHLALPHPHVSSAALIKFNLPNIFPQHERILYLDGDIVCFSDLYDLYHLSLEGHYAAVVKDMAAMTDEGHHSRINHSSYFNSGVMLLNLSKMREDNVSDKLIELKSRRIYQHFMDQDEFNVVFDENVIYMPPSHNLMVRNFNHSQSETAQFYEVESGKFQNMLDYPLLKHLTNSPKVWCNPKDKDFESWVQFLPGSLFTNYIWFLDDLISLRAQQAESKAQEAESKAQEAESKAQQAESKAQQAEVVSNERLVQLRAVYSSSSWKVTKPLRAIKRLLACDFAALRWSTAAVELKAKRTFRPVLVSAIAYANKQPMLNNFLKRVVARFPALDKILRQIHQKTRFGIQMQGASYFPAHQSGIVGKTITPDTFQSFNADVNYVRSKGLNADQRPPLEANFINYLGRR